MQRIAIAYRQRYFGNRRTADQQQSARLRQPPVLIQPLLGHAASYTAGRETGEALKIGLQRLSLIAAQVCADAELIQRAGDCNRIIHIYDI